ncbi:MAG: response regulator [Pseudobacteriovorax sp.]|nr:response regulator [Pseudobacteriovorax sp.]
MNILLIDDNLDLLKTVKEMIPAEHNVTLATDALQGSELFNKGDFDLVVTDIDMPGTGGGLRLVSEAASRDKTVVVYTGSIAKPKEYYKSIGAKRVFFKAIDDDELVKFLSSL